MNAEFSKRRIVLRRKLSLVTSALVAMTGLAQAQDGYYDNSWGAGGRLLVDVGPSGDRGKTMAIRSDGQLILGGHCRGPFQQGRSFCVVRLRPNGQFDLSFGPNGNGRILLTEQAGFPDTTHNTHGLALQTDGRILLTGKTDIGIGILVRLSATGLLEPAASGDLYTTIPFSIPPSFPHESTGGGIAVTSNGKIVVAGSTYRSGSDPPNVDFGVARFNPDRTPDSGFGDGGIRLAAFDLGGSGYDVVNDVTIQQDGKIVVAGFATGADGRAKAALLRLDVDGDPDTSFGNNGRVWFDRNTLDPGHILANAVAIDRQGRVVVVGTKQRNDTFNYDFMIARLGVQGQLDGSFGNASGVVLASFDLGGTMNDVAYDLALQSDGKILIVGSATADTMDTYVFAVVRLTDDGHHDPTFGIGGRSLGTFAPPEEIPSHSFASAIAVGSGGIFVAGSNVGDNDRFGVSKIRLNLIFTDGFQ